MYEIDPSEVPDDLLEGTGLKKPKMPSIENTARFSKRNLAKILDRTAGI
jgi:hypothetical protein